VRADAGEALDRTAALATGASEDPALAAQRIQLCPAGSDLLTALLAGLIARSAR